PARSWAGVAPAGALIAVGALLLTQTVLGDGEGKSSPPAARPAPTAIVAGAEASPSARSVGAALDVGRSPAGSDATFASVDPTCLGSSAETIYDGGWANVCE